MKTVKDAYEVFKKELTKSYSLNEIRSITNLLLGNLTGLSNAQLAAFSDRELTVTQQQSLSHSLSQLCTGRPVQYILGHAAFYGLDFLVTPSVLIPRPETEELVDWILKTTPSGSGITLLDIGTGSGCIPITIKNYLIDSKLFAIDISTEALNIARQNAMLNNAEVTFAKADILNLQAPVITGQKYDIIVSNPPYVTGADKQLMHHNVTGFEPHMALFVPDADPLLFYRAIARFAAGNLVEQGRLFFEINESYGEQMVDLLEDIGFVNIELRQDMNGKDRMIKAVYKTS